MDYESLYSTATKALNTQLEINDKLKDTILQLKKRIEVLQRNRNNIFNQKVRNYKRVKELEADNAKLIEGQQAMLTAGSGGKLVD